MAESSSKKKKTSMKSDALDKIADALSADVSKETEFFFAEGMLSPTDITIEVEDFGQLSLPLKEDSVKNLIAVSTKAKFGKGKQTLLDENVRDTQEIPSSKLKVKIKEEVLSQMLSDMCQKFGLDKNSSLTAHLHNLLIYSPGQFFDFHQDTEKLEHMNSSLVLALPSPHIGGDLVICLGAKTHTFRSENLDANDIKCIAFYADCKHKIEQVRMGYRVALTYNLVTIPPAISEEENQNQKLYEGIKSYFEIASGVHPLKLVYFLSHSYTERSLNWNMMKGSDIINVSQIVNVAKGMGLKYHLALVKIREEWFTSANENGDYDPCYDELVELVEDDITLSYWVDSAGKKLPYGNCDIEHDEVCWTVETKSFDIIESKSHGYTGNEGVNLEQWYRRAAIVLWPESSQVSMNFKVNYQNALEELTELTDAPENFAEVTEIMKKAKCYLHQNCDKKENLKKWVKITLFLQDKDSAQSILSHFQWKMLDSGVAELLVKLQEQYGISWCIELLNKWKNTTYSCIREDFDTFVCNLLKHNLDMKIVEFFLETQCSAIINGARGEYSWRSRLGDRFMSENFDVFHQLLATCAKIKNTVIVDKIIQHLISHPKVYLEIPLAEFYFKLKKDFPPDNFVCFKGLEDYLIKTIDDQLAKGAPSDEDWAIPVKMACSCADCNVIALFLQSKTEARKVWPLAVRRHKHIMSKMKSLTIPVNTSVVTSCSPQQLVLEKRADRHETAKKKFLELQSCRKKFN